jgi:hypothetical protein
MFEFDPADGPLPPRIHQIDGAPASEQAVCRSCGQYRPADRPIDRPASTWLLADWTMTAKSTDQLIDMRFSRALYYGSRLYSRERSRTANLAATGPRL